MLWPLALRWTLREKALRSFVLLCLSTSRALVSQYPSVIRGTHIVAIIIVPSNWYTVDSQMLRSLIQYPLDSYPLTPSYSLSLRGEGKKRYYAMSQYYVMSCISGTKLEKFYRSTNIWWPRKAIPNFAFHSDFWFAFPNCSLVLSAVHRTIYSLIPHWHTFASFYWRFHMLSVFMHGLVYLIYSVFCVFLRDSMSCATRVI